MAVFNTPTPIGFVIINLSPGFAVAFDKTLFGLTIPETERPYLGSLSSTVCPPTKSAPLSFTLSNPPFNISASTSISWHDGKQTIFIATKGLPPIAYTSDSEFDAAI